MIKKIQSKLSVAIIIRKEQKLAMQIQLIYNK